MNFDWLKRVSVSNFLEDHGLKLEQIAADDYYDFEIVNMKSLQDWIVYMLTIPSWHFFSKNIQN